MGQAAQGGHVQVSRRQRAACTQPTAGERGRYCLQGVREVHVHVPLLCYEPLQPVPRNISKEMDSRLTYFSQDFFLPLEGSTFLKILSIILSSKVVLNHLHIPHPTLYIRATQMK